MSESPSKKSPLDHAVDLFVYAPIGFVLEARSLLPRMVDRGRSEVALARALGEHTLRGKGGETAARSIDRGQVHARNTLRILGLLPDDEVGSPPAGGNGQQPPGGTETGAPVPANSAAGEVVTAQVPAPQGDSQTDEPAVPLPDHDSLAIPGYESLSASQVVPRLDGLTADELESIRQYEAGRRRRATILNKIAQLQAS